MEITIHTLHGTFIVPSNKLMDLVAWLKANAIAVNQQSRPTEHLKSNDGRNLILE